ncbi:hypothetical protein F2981_05025 [Sinorhizobium meliloti]|nr:hypothetical protein [Sinorhizobium meliloti]
MFLSTLSRAVHADSGLALFYGGLVRAKNMLSVLMQCTVHRRRHDDRLVVYGYSLPSRLDERLFRRLRQALPRGCDRRQHRGDLLRRRRHSGISFQCCSR